MAVPALKFVAGTDPGLPARAEIAASMVAALKSEAAHQGPTAYVLRTKDLDEFRRAKDLVVDRGTKLPRKELASTLLGQPAVPLIAGSHTAGGQLRRSVRRLLERAAACGDRNAFLVGADEPVFDELWQAAPAGRQESSSDIEALLDLLPPAKVPEELTRRFIGVSLQARLVRQLVMRAADQNDPVLIVGDTGTGKEVVARAIHDYSKRRLETFVAVNCAAIPQALLESELFGHEPGAFTDAKYRKAGLWSVANRGTLFLDEIGDLRLDHQAKILRALQEGTIRPVGALEDVPVRSRVIAATNRNLFEMVQAGRFREDLYYRLRSFFIPTPSLGSYPEDIPLLANAFWRGITNDPRAALGERVLAALSARDWPGNARELRAVLSHLHALFGVARIDLDHLNAVSRLHAGMSGRGAARMNAAAAHRAECLHHLRRTAEIVRACEVTLGPLMDGRRSAPVRRAFKQRLGELELVCLQPALFSSEPAYRAVAGLRDGLAAMLPRLDEDGARARAQWAEQLVPAFRTALSAILDEIARLTKHP